MASRDTFEIIGDIAKRRGFFWPSYEIYGGVAGFLTFGPLGTILKRNIEDKFREFFIRRFGFVEIETSVIVPGIVFEASGHVEHFKEPMTECRKCRRRFRADHLLQEFAKFSDTETEKMSLRELMEATDQRGIRCPECGGLLDKPEYFLTMFNTTIGPYSKNMGYGRPEAAQAIFTEFKRIYDVTRGKLPIGVAQIGHALRNEVSPRQGPIRLREFTIMDLELFFDPSDPKCPHLDEVKNEVLRLISAENKVRGDERILEVSVKESLRRGIIKNEWLAFFMALSEHFLEEIGIPGECQRFVEKLEWERAHYSRQGFDQEVILDRLGWIEVSGHNLRSDYDLKRHMEHSGVDLMVYKEFSEPKNAEKIYVKPNMSKIGPTFKGSSEEVRSLLNEADPKEIERSFRDKGFYQAGKYRIFPEHVEIKKEVEEIKGRRFLPHVVEPSFGSDRLTYAALLHSYRSKEGRFILKLPPDIAPLQIAVLPLVAKDGLEMVAYETYERLLGVGFRAEYDDSGSIGRRYARADEVGIPLAITIDYTTLKDDTVTIRDRDSWKQIRSRRVDLPKVIREYLNGNMSFEDMGEPISKNNE